jgi:hypothetical protein
MMTIQNTLKTVSDGHEGDEGPKATSSNGELKSTIMDSGVGNNDIASENTTEATAQKKAEDLRSPGISGLLPSKQNFLPQRSNQGGNSVVLLPKHPLLLVTEQTTL